MGTTFYLNWEPALMIWMQSMMGPALTKIADIISMFGEEMLMILVLGFLYWCYDKKYGEYVGTNIIFGVVLNPLIKNIALRRRPYFDHEGIQCLKPVDKSADIYDISAQGYSFPSGHSMNSAILYGSVARYRRTKGLVIVAIVLPLLVGLSRVMLGVHYPTDVLVGWGVGALVVLVLPWIRDKIKNRTVFHITLVVLALPGIFYCRTTDYFTGLGLMIGFFLALPFEEKYVQFAPVDYKGTKWRAVLQTVLRVIGGGAVYFGLNQLLKMPFSKEFLEAQTVAAFLVRTVRYAIVTFVTIGVYPFVFRISPFRNGD